jgi:hypothetical protein
MKANLSAKSQNEINQFRVPCRKHKFSFQIFVSASNRSYDYLVFFIIQLQKVSDESDAIISDEESLSKQRSSRKITSIGNINASVISSLPLTGLKIN